MILYVGGMKKKKMFVNNLRVGSENPPPLDYLVKVILLLLLYHNFIILGYPNV